MLPQIRSLPQAQLTLAAFRECSDFRGMGVPPVPFGTAKMAIPQEVLDYMHKTIYTIELN